MAELFHISPEIRNLARSAISTMINQLGKDCKLVIEGEVSPCPNCHFDSINQRSSGVYNGTGPRPFDRPPCPVCKGTGYDSTNRDQEVVRRFLIDWKPRAWQYVAPGTVVPQGIIQLKGFLVDLPEVLQSKYIIVDYENAIYQNHRFVKWGEPIPQGNIVPNEFFISFWQRA